MRRVTASLLIVGFSFGVVSGAGAREARLLHYTFRITISSQPTETWSVPSGFTVTGSGKASWTGRWIAKLNVDPANHRAWISDTVAPAGATTPAAASAFSGTATGAWSGMTFDKAPYQCSYTFPATSVISGVVLTGAGLDAGVVQTSPPSVTGYAHSGKFGLSLLAKSVAAQPNFTCNTPSWRLPAGPSVFLDASSCTYGSLDVRITFPVKLLTVRVGYGFKSVGNQNNASKSGQLPCTALGAGETSTLTGVYSLQVKRLK